MKKSPFLSLGIAIIAFIATTFKTEAAVIVKIYDPNSASITWNQAEVPVEVTGYSGASFQMMLKYQAAGDTVKYTPLTVYTYDWLLISLTGLPSATLISVQAIVIDGVDTTQSGTISFTTNPFPKKAGIWNVQVLPSPQQGLVSFSYKVDVATEFFARYDNYQNQTASFIAQPGTGTGSLLITNPYVIGTTYSLNLLRGRALSGIVPDSTVLFGPFTVPNYTKPTAANLIFSNVTQDSFKFSCVIMLGNAASGSVIIDDLDSVGNVVFTHPTITVTNDTVIAKVRTSLPYILSGQMVRVITLGGADTSVAFRRTLQVLAPDVMSVDTVNATTSGTSIVLEVKTNGKPSWPTSNCVLWGTYKDKNNNTVTLPTVALGTNSAVITQVFTGLVNLKPNPATNTATFYGKNDAGLLDSMVINFKLPALLPAVPIQNNFQVDAENAHQIKIWGVNAGPSQNPYDVVALINAQGSGLVDTVLTRFNQIGFTDPTKRDTAGNRTGGVTYEVRLGTRNADGVMLVTQPAKTVTMVSAALPSFFISTSSINPSATTVAFRFLGSANGTPSYARCQAIEKSSGMIDGQVDIGYLGTGDFDISSTISDLSICTNYELKITVHNGQFLSQVFESKDFSTDCTTAIDDVVTSELVSLFPNPVHSMLSVTAATNAPDGIGKCAIFSMVGSRAAEYDFTGQTEAQISCSDLPDGMYILKGENFMQRFVKQ